MAYDGSIIIDTSIDTKGLQDGLGLVGSIAKTAMGSVSVATGTAGSALATLTTNTAKGIGTTTSLAGSVQGLNAMLTQTSTGGMQQMNSIMQEMATNTTELDSTYANTTVSLSESVKKIKGNFSGLGAAILNTNQGPLAELSGIFLQASSNIATSFEIGGFDGLSEQLGVSLTEVTTKITEYLPSIISGGVSIINSLIAGIQQNIPQIIQTGMAAITSLIDGINQLMPTLIPLAQNIIMSLGTSLIDNLPAIIDAAAQIILALALGITEMLPELLPKILDIILTIANTLIDNLPTIIDAAMQIVLALALGIAEMLPELIPKIIELVLTIEETLIDNIDLLMDASIALIMGLAEGLIAALPSLIEKIPEIIIKLCDCIIRNSNKLTSAALELLSMLGKGLIAAIPTLTANIPKVIQAIILAFTTVLTNICIIGANIIDGLWEGITGKKGWLTDKLKSLCTGVIDGIKGFFGIHSPSRVMRDEVGNNIVEGIAAGIDENADTVTKALNNVNNGVLESERVFLSEKKRIDDERAKQEEEKNIKEYNERLANAKTAAEAEEIKQKEILRLKKLADDNYLKSLEEKAKNEKAIIEKIKDNIVGIYTDMAKEAESSMKEIEKLQEKMTQKLQNYGKLYETTKTTIKGMGEHGEDIVTKETKVRDLTQDIKDLEAYKAAIEGVSKRGASLEFMGILKDMSVEEGTNFANTLNGLNKEEFDKYLADWGKKQQLAADIAKGTKDSKGLYDDEEAALKAEIEDDLNDNFGQIPEKFWEFGKDAAKNFADAFVDEVSAYKDSIISAAAPTKNTASTGQAAATATGGQAAAADNTANAEQTEAALEKSGEAVKTATDDTLLYVKGELEKAGLEIPKGFFESGVASVNSFGEGFMSKVNEVMAKIESAISAGMATIAPALSYAGGAATVSGGTTNIYNTTYEFASSGETVSQQILAAANAAAVKKLRG